MSFELQDLWQEGGDSPVDWSRLTKIVHVTKLNSRQSDRSPSLDQRTRVRRRGWPTFVAFAIAPAIVAGVATVCLFLVALGNSPTSTPARQFIGLWVMLAVVASAAQWTLGLGWHVLAIRKNWRRANGYLLAGAAVGASIGVAYAAALESD